MRKRILTEDDYSNLTTKQDLEEYKFEQSNLIDRVRREVDDKYASYAKDLTVYDNGIIKTTDGKKGSSVTYGIKNALDKKANESDLPDLTAYATNQEVEDLYNGLKTEIEELKKLIK